MSPFRLIILSILVYVLFRLLIGSGRRVDVGKGRSMAGAGKWPAQDVLMEDPVCHTLIPARSAITMKMQGEKLYFCSESCRDQFITNQSGEER